MVMVLYRKSHWVGCLSLTFLPQNQQGFSFMGSSYGGSPQINGPDRHIERHKVFVSRPMSQSYRTIGFLLHKMQFALFSVLPRFRFLFLVVGSLIGCDPEWTMA